MTHVQERILSNFICKVESKNDCNIRYKSNSIPIIYYAKRNRKKRKVLTYYKYINIRWLIFKHVI